MMTLATVLPVLLTGCADLYSSSGPVSVASLRGGDIIVAAPAGLCVDAQASDLLAGFALMAPCVTLQGQDTAKSTSAVVTVQAGLAGSASVIGSEQTLVTLFESDEGAALLSDTGNSSAVNVTSTASNPNDVRVAFDEKGAATIAGTTGTVRRAFFDVGSRLVTISVRSLVGDPLTNRAGRDLLVTLVGAIKQANPDPSQQSSRKLFPVLQQFGRYVTSIDEPVQGT